MKVIDKQKVDHSEISIGERTLTDGSKVYNFGIDGNYIECVSFKHASDLFMVALGRYDRVKDKYTHFSKRDKV